MCSNLKNGFKDLKLAEKFAAYEKRGIVIGLVIALFVIAITTIAILKYHWLKKQFDCLQYDLDDLYDDEDLDEDECCCAEGDCCVANERDFEK